MKKIIKYLYLDNLGLPELLLAFYLIMSGYVIDGIPMSLLSLLIIDMFYLNRKISFAVMPKFRNWFIYLILHIILLAFVLIGENGLPDYYINMAIQIVVMCLSCFIIVPNINLLKFKGALSLVAIMSMIGIIYHFFLFIRGISFHPIALPFLPDPDTNSRLFELFDRPCSFFWEPAAYCAYMLVVLNVFLLDKKYVGSVVIALSIMLSTSTTGFFTVIISYLAMALLNTKISKINRIIILTLSCFFYIAYRYLNIFSFGLEKIEHTSIETNVRLSNGIPLLNTLDFPNLIFGVPYANSTDYALETSSLVSQVAVYDSTVYLPIWIDLLTTYGLVGMVFYLAIYWNLAKNYTFLIPFILTLVARMFSDPGIISSLYIFNIIFMMIFAKQYNHKTINTR